MDKVYDSLITNYAQKYDLYDQIINLILVSSKARSSFLFETTNLKGDENLIKKVFDAVDELNLSLTEPLKYTVDDSAFPRYFIYLTDSWVDKIIKKNPDVVNNDFWIARFLDFQCAGHNYSNQLKDRIIINYNVKNHNISIMTEVCELEKVVENEINSFANENNKKFNKVLNPLGFETSVSIDIDYSMSTRYNMLKEKDIKYVKDNLIDYHSDFVNYYISDDDVYDSSQIYNNLENILQLSDRNLEKLTKLYYKAMIEDKYDHYYKNAKTHGKITKVAEKIKKEDDLYWSKDGSDNKKPKKSSKKIRKSSKKK